MKINFSRCQSFQYLNHPNSLNSFISRGNSNNPKIISCINSHLAPDNDCQTSIVPRSKNHPPNPPTLHLPRLINSPLDSSNWHSIPTTTNSKDSREGKGGIRRRTGRTTLAILPVRVVSFSRIAAFHGLVPCFLSIAALCCLWWWRWWWRTSVSTFHHPSTFVQRLCGFSLPCLTTLIRTLGRVWLSSTASLPSRFSSHSRRFSTSFQNSSIVVSSVSRGLFISILHELIEFD